MEKKQTGQVSGDAAEVYETFFLPALFSEWAPRLLDAARVKEGSRVLDVACGTGVVAREAARRVGEGGAVVGLDRNPAMLAVARKKAPAVEWREGRAEALPFPDASFDAVTCQFGLMFFEDRVGALREMWRVLAPGGALAVATWDAVERQGDGPLVPLAERLLGKDAAVELAAPYVLGDPEALLGLFRDAGIGSATLRTVQGTGRYASVPEYVRVIIKGWTLADKVSDEAMRAVEKEVEAMLKPYAQVDGSIVMPTPAHVVSAEKR